MGLPCNEETLLRGGNHGSKTEAIAMLAPFFIRERGEKDR
jgi:hypothetical protein